MTSRTVVVAFAPALPESVDALLRLVRAAARVAFGANRTTHVTVHTLGANTHLAEQGTITGSLSGVVHPLPVLADLGSLLRIPGTARRRFIAFLVLGRTGFTAAAGFARCASTSGARSSARTATALRGSTFTGSRSLLDRAGTAAHGRLSACTGTRFCRAHRRRFDVEHAVTRGSAREDQHAGRNQTRQEFRRTHYQKAPRSDTWGEPSTRLVASCVRGALSALK